MPWAAMARVSSSPVHTSASMTLTKLRCTGISSVHTAGHSSTASADLALPAAHPPVKLRAPPINLLPIAAR